MNLKKKTVQEDEKERRSVGGFQNIAKKKTENIVKENNFLLVVIM
jgi:hypothetical protein